MNITLVNQQTELLVSNGHRVLQIHRFGDDEFTHVSRLEKWADLPLSAKVIDMGSGTGEVANIFTEIRPDLKFTLVNISQFQLDYSPYYLSHCCDYCQVPEPDSSFDAVMFCFSIGHSNYMNAMKEAARLLKCGGVLFIYDMVRVSGNNQRMNEVDYAVHDRSMMESSAKKCGFKLDVYIEPSDDGKYGNALFGSAFHCVFGGTIPAIWRFIKC